MTPLMKIESVKLSSLRKTKALRRKHSADQFERCIHSIMKWGQYAPLVVSGNEVLCGTMVYDAMKRLKMKTAMVVQVGELSDEKKRELRYLDNRTFDMSFWKDDELTMFLMGLDRDGLEDCGFKEDEVESMVNGFREEGKRAKKKILDVLNEQPDTWYCPDCGWIGTMKEKRGENETT